MDSYASMPSKLPPQHKWLRLTAPVFLASILTTLILFFPVFAAQKSPTPALLRDSSLVDTFAVQAAGNLSITKSASPAQTVNQGSLMTYTLIITNNTDEALNSLAVVDPLPLHTSCALTDGGQIFNAVDSSGGEWLGSQASCSGGSAQWVYLNINIPNPPPGFDTNPGGAFEPGESVALKFQVRVAQPLRNRIDTIDNITYTVYSSNPDYTVAGTTPVTNLVFAPEWDIGKTAVPSQTVRPGEQLTYTITVTNVGDLATSGPYTITEVLPQYVNYVSSTLPVSVTDKTLTWVRSGSLGVDSTDSVQVMVTVTQQLTNALQIINDTYSVAGGAVFSPAVGTPVTVSVESPITLTVQKIDTDPVQASDLLTYTITITNDASSRGPALGLVFTDVVPTNTLYVDHGFSGGTSGLLDTDGSVVTWTVQSPLYLPIGETVQLTLSVRTLSPLPNSTVITNSRYGATVSNTLFIAPPVPVTTTINSIPNITLTKTVTPNLVVARQQVTYTITVTNSGNETAINLPFTDVVQAPDFTPAQATWALTVPGRNLAGQVGVVSYTLVMTAGDAPGDFPNVVTTTVRGSPIVIGPVATVTVRPPVDLQIDKQQVGVGDVIAGNPITYTLTLTNAGPETAAARVTDVFTNATLITYTLAGYAPNVCNQTAANTINCYLPAFTNTTVMTVVLATSPGISGVVTNTAVITPGLPGLGDPITTNNRSVVTTTARYRRADLQISKTRLGSGEVIAGDAITYTLTLTNAPGSDIVDAVVTDTFTGTVTSVSATAGGGQGCSGSGPIVCGFDDFTGTETITVVLQTAASFSGTLTNTAEITFAAGFTATEENRLDNDDSVTTTVRYPRADLQISKTRLGSGEVIAGDAITYTLTLTNAPGSDSVDAAVTDIFTNAGFDDYSITYPGGNCTPAGQQLNCSLPTFTGTTIITLVLDTSDSVSGTITNTAEITFAAGFTATEENQLDNNDSVTTPVRYPIADLQISKTRLGSGEVTAGDAITYTLTLTNAPGSDSVDAVVTDTFTGTVTSVSATPGGGQGCSGSGPIVCGFDDFTGTETITVVLQTANSFSGTLTNTAQIAAVTANTIDAPGNNSDTVTDTVRRLTADLQIAKTGPSLSVAGDPVTYTVVITNPGDAVDVVVTDTFNYGSYQSATATGGGVCSGSGPILCSFSNFSGVATITVVLNTPGSVTGMTLNNSVIITTSLPNAIDPNPDNNNAGTTTLVRPRQTNLQLEKSLVGSSPVLAGEQLTFTLTITNVGPDIVNATLGDTATPPEAIDGIAVTEPAGWNCSIGVNSISCNNVQFGLTSQTFTVVLTTSAAYAGVLNNAANVQPGATTIELDPDDNADDVDVELVFPTAPVLTITKTASPANGLTVSPGDTIRYTLAVTNNGNAAAGSVVITDDLDGGVAFVTGSGSTNGSGISENAGQVTVSAGTLGIGQALTATWEVTVTASTSGTIISNVANARSTATALITSNLVAHRVITLPAVSPVYLPLILKNCCFANLVIDSFTVNNSTNPPSVQVVVKNVGLGSTGSGFWVDLYVNPSPEPVSLLNAANPGDRRWQRLKTNVDRGIAWEITTPLAAGDSIILTETSSEVNGAQTSWSALPGSSHLFYTFADSFDADNNRFVEIEEGNDANELDNQAVFGPVSVSGLAIEEAVDAAAEPPQAAPPRRNLGP